MKRSQNKSSRSAPAPKRSSAAETQVKRTSATQPRQPLAPVRTRQSRSDYSADDRQEFTPQGGRWASSQRGSDQFNSGDTAKKWTGSRRYADEFQNDERETSARTSSRQNLPNENDDRASDSPYANRRDEEISSNDRVSQRQDERRADGYRGQRQSNRAGAGRSRVDQGRDY